MRDATNVAIGQSLFPSFGTVLQHTEDPCLGSFPIDPPIPVGVSFRRDALVKSRPQRVIQAPTRTASLEILPDDLHLIQEFADLEFAPLTQSRGRRDVNLAMAEQVAQDQQVVHRQ